MPIPYSSTNWATHHEVAAPQVEYPIPGELSAVLVTRTYEGPRSGYVFQALNTADPGSVLPNITTSNRYLVVQGPLEHVDGDAIRYQRTYATVPNTHYEADTFVALYPAFLDNRAQFSATTPRRITHEYFLVGTGGSYANADLIPIVAESLANFATSNISVPLLSGGFFLNNGGSGVDTSTPSRTNYVANVAADTANANSYSIISEPSSITRWQGNIWRRTKYEVKAK